MVAQRSDLDEARRQAQRWRRDEAPASAAPHSVEGMCDCSLWMFLAINRTVKVLFPPIGERT